MPVTTATRLEAIVTDLGGRPEAARMIGVDHAQLTRWLDGAEAPDRESERNVEAIELTLARLMHVFDRSTSVRWLAGTNALFGGDRPIDLLTMGRLPEVLNGIDAEVAGSFA